ARNAALLIEQDFNVVIDLALNEPPAVLPRDFVYLRFPIVDGGGNDQDILAAAIKTIVLLMELGEFKIAVCCGAGLSRSPGIAAAAIAMARNQDAEQTLAELALQMRCDVSSTLWSDISKIHRVLTR